MIPLSDPENRYRGFPIATILIIALNVLVFLYQVSLSDQALETFIYAYGTLPIEITASRDVGPPSPEPVWLTIFTSMFLHGGWVHLGSNMLYLWVFGDNVEEALGTPLYVSFYLATGVAGALAHIMTDPVSTIPSIGASGAISGVLAAYMVLYPGARVNTLLVFFPFIRIVALPAIALIGFWIILQLVSGFGALGVTNAGGVAYWAHIGGFGAGLLLALPFRGQGRRRRSARQPQLYFGDS